MRILALDIATKCGFAYGTIEDLATGTWNFEAKRDDSKGMKLVKFKAQLNKLRESGVGLMVFERVAGFHKTGIISNAEMHGVAKEWAETAEIPYRAYSAKEIKLYATGKGGASKGDMMGAAIHKFGRECADDNEADALALWHLAYTEYGDGDGIPPTQPVLKQRPAKKKGRTPNRKAGDDPL